MILVIVGGVLCDVDYNINQFVQSMEGQIEELHCPICMMIFQRPVTISCGHTFCYSCLNNSIRDNRSCPICRQQISYNISKMKIDERINLFVQSYKKKLKKQQQPMKEATNIKCKVQKLLLIDIMSQDLLLPYNKIHATFQLQNNSLIDRMERFVARQEAPFHSYSIICHLVHIEQIRKNLYQGVIQGKSFCTVESQNIESQLNLQLQDDQQEFYYRMCNASEINEVSNINPKEYDNFILTFYSINQEYIKQIVYKKIDPNIFSYKNDSVGIFYSILGIVNMNNQEKYELAISFDEGKRLSKIKEYMKLNSHKITKNPSRLIKISLDSGGMEKKFIFLIIFGICMYIFAQFQISSSQVEY